MKKLFITFMMCCLACPIFAQYVSFQAVHADPVQVAPPTRNTGSFWDPLGLSSGQTIQAPQVQKSNNNYQTVNAYVVKDNKFKKIKIKVFEKGQNIYVNSFYIKENNMWYNAFNTNAFPTVKSDGEVIYDNFDYKSAISGLGYIYF